MQSFVLRKIESRSRKSKAPTRHNSAPLRDPLTPCVAATILCREVVELRLQFRRELIVRGSERVGQLLGSARTENDGRNSRVRQDPGDCQFRQRFAFFASDLTQLTGCLELALMPVAGHIRGAEL